MICVHEAPYCCFCRALDHPWIHYPILVYRCTIHWLVRSKQVFLWFWDALEGPNRKPTKCGHTLRMLTNGQTCSNWQSPRTDHSKHNTKLDFELRSCKWAPDATVSQETKKIRIVHFASSDCLPQDAVFDMIQSNSFIIPCRQRDRAIAISTKTDSFKKGCNSKKTNSIKASARAMLDRCTVWWRFG